jgi:ABC-type multidrug transport system fused ATPase/permease subunit
LRDALISFWRQVVETGLVVVATIGLLAWYDPLLARCPLPLTAIGLGILVRQTDALVALDRATGAAYDAVNQDLAEGVNGVRVIKAFALEGTASNVSRRWSAPLCCKPGCLGFAATRIPVPQVVVALGHVWILLYGSHLVAEGSSNFGELVSALMILNTWCSVSRASAE